MDSGGNAQVYARYDGYYVITVTHDYEKISLFSVLYDGTDSYFMGHHLLSGTEVHLGTGKFICIYRVEPIVR